MIYVGTSGYSYADWRGHFYPEKMSNPEMLPFYAERFRFTEVNSTYYRIPNKYMLYNMQKKTPPGFLFVIKAFQGLTHDRKDTDGQFREFVDALEPLVEVEKLACILAQFPTSFHNSKANRDYLKTLREGFCDLPVVVEFRHRSWLDESVLELLNSQELGFVCVDEPNFPSLMPPSAKAAGNIGYIRFHGRNYEKWWKHEHAWERYNYLYSQEELLEWVPKIADISSKTKMTFVAMNNHYQAQAVTNAQMMLELLKKGGLSVAS